MFQGVIAGSLTHRHVVIALAVGLLLYGVWTAGHARLDVLPDFAPPQADIQTEAPGFAPEQVERLVTLPIETALGGVPGLAVLRSESIQGLSVITAVFDEATNVYIARQSLAERLADIGPGLPSGVSPPRLSPLTSATMDVLSIGLTSHLRSPMELRTLADWTIRPRLLMVPGVARVNVFGGEVRQLQLQLRPESARAHGVALADVVASARAATSLRGAGFVETANQRFILDVANGLRGPSDLGDALLEASGTLPVRLRDVATITEGAAPRFGDAIIQGKPGVLLTLSSAYGANTMEVTQRLEQALAELRPMLKRERVTLYPALHRPASFIESAIGDLKWSIAAGATLVVLVLLLFLQNTRAALISLTAIPLSLLAAVVVLTRLGVTLNTMSLGGLAIAIGEVVDDAIIDVDNIARRLHGRAAGTSAYAVTLAASLEVRRAVVFATGAVALVFLPLLDLGGLQGKFFAPLALSYLLAILASLVVALTVTPALALTFLGPRPPREAEPWLQVRARAAYERLLRLVWRHQRSVLGVIVAAALGLLSLTPLLAGEFLPKFREHHLVVHVIAAPGTGMQAMRRLAERLAHALLALPGVETVSQQDGRAEQGEDTWEPNRGEIQIELAAGADDVALTDRVRDVLDATPGVQTEVLTFLGDRISESISGETAPVVVSVFGDDLQAIDAKAAEIGAVMRATPGSVDVRVASGATGPHVAIALRPDELASRGVRPVEVLDTLETAFAGSVVGQVYRGAQPIDVVVTLPPDARRDPTQVGSLLVQAAGGGTAPVADLADVAIAPGRDVIRHEGARRRQTVTCNISGRDVTSFVRDLKSRIARAVELPSGMYLTFGGTAEARAGAVRDLALHAIAGFLGVVVLLAVVAQHWQNLGLLLLNLPLALAGGVAAAWITGAGLSLGALVGFVALFGITLRNAILMLTHYQHLVRAEGRPWTPETALEGASDRLVPILMTALVTSLGLLPVALSAGRPGGEIDGPMAIVILGGLVTSTTLNLLLLPTLASRYGRFGPDDLALGGEGA